MLAKMAMWMKFSQAVFYAESVDQRPDMVTCEKAYGKTGHMNHRDARDYKTTTAELQPY